MYRGNIYKGPLGTVVQATGPLSSGKKKESVRPFCLFALRPSICTHVLPNSIACAESTFELVKGCIVLKLPARFPVRLMIALPFYQHFAAEASSASAVLGPQDALYVVFGLLIGCLCNCRRRLSIISFLGR